MSHKRQMEEKVLNAVEALPEVKTLMRSPVDSDCHMGLWVGKWPDSQFCYFWVHVGIRDPHFFHTLEHFYVVPKTYEVKYLDIVSDSVWSLKEWRRHNSAASAAKRH